MSKTYVTITGTHHYFGTDFLKKGKKVTLEKEPDNKFDKEAIMVMLPGLGKIGYVANSTHTVIGDCMSAGRLYDKIGKKAAAEVLYVTKDGVICEVAKKEMKK